MGHGYQNDGNLLAGNYIGGDQGGNHELGRPQIDDVRPLKRKEYPLLGTPKKRSKGKEATKDDHEVEESQQHSSGKEFAQELRKLSTLVLEMKESDTAALQREREALRYQEADLQRKIGELLAAKETAAGHTAELSKLQQELAEKALQNERLRTDNDSLRQLVEKQKQDPERQSIHEVGNTVFLSVRPSTITGAGEGLFAVSSIPGGTYIGDFHGSVKYESEILGNETANGKVWDFQLPGGKDFVVDPWCLMGKMNHMNHREDCNAIILNQGEKFLVYSWQDIPPGEEIFVNYG